MRRALLLFSVLVASVSRAEGWRPAGEEDGLKVETREVAGSSFEEIRVTGTFATTPARACEAIWAKDLDPAQPWFLTREVVRETANDRWYYEVVNTPLVEDRDYTVHLWRASGIAEGCLIRFDLDASQGPAPKKGMVRMKGLRGSWLVTGAAKGAQVVYTLYNDPGGNVPALLSRGSQRSRAVAWVKAILARSLR